MSANGTGGYKQWIFSASESGLSDLLQLSTRAGQTQARLNVAHTVEALRKVGIFGDRDKILYYVDDSIPEIHTFDSIAKSAALSLRKNWYQVGSNILIYVSSDESPSEAYHRYIKAIEVLNRKCEGDVPASVKDKIARVASRFGLDMDIIDRFGLRHKSSAHASYDPPANELRITPEYLARQGVPG